MKLLDQLVNEREEIGTSMASVCDAAAEETRDLSPRQRKRIFLISTLAPTPSMFASPSFGISSSLTLRPRRCAPR